MICVNRQKAEKKKSTSSAAFCLRCEGDENDSSQFFQGKPASPCCRKPASQKPKEHERREGGFEKKTHILRVTRARAHEDADISRLRFHITNRRAGNAKQQN